MLRLQPPVSTLTHVNPAGQGQICLKIHFSLLSGGPLPAEALGEEEPVAAQRRGGALAWKTLAVLGGVTSGGNLGVSSAPCRLGMAGKRPTAASGAEALRGSTRPGTVCPFGPGEPSEGRPAKRGFEITHQEHPGGAQTLVALDKN